MNQCIVKNFIKSAPIFSLVIIFLTNPVYAEETNSMPSNYSELIREAEEYLLLGEYKKSIAMYDDILEIFPAESKIHEMKAIALSNIRLQSTLGSQQIQNPSGDFDKEYLNRLSMLEFYKALAINPDSTVSLNGLGVGFGNFAEYDEAKKYFLRTLEIDPSNFVAKNYLNYIEKILKKYPVKYTEKPSFLLNLEKNEVPYWVKTNASWWASGKISDNDFIAGIQYLVKNKIIKLNSETIKKNSSNIIPEWIKNNAKWWSAGIISDKDFLSGIKYLIINGIINVDVQENSEIMEKELERKTWNFERYLEKIERDIKNEKRYIEYPNPSSDVIIRYWKDYYRWNLEQHFDRPKDYFPSPTISSVGDTRIINYKIFVNEQPPGLPLDHISTLQNSIRFWEETEFSDSDGKKVVINFEITNSRNDASVWVTWVVRNLGEGVLGHASIGKGIVEVALGDYGCDGGFQLFTVDTVEQIMTHELGHSLTLRHSDNPNSIMYPSINEVNYSYCLLT